MPANQLMYPSFVLSWLVALFLTAAPALAEDRWASLTSRQNPKCSDQNPCRVSNDGLTFSIEFSPIEFSFGRKTKQKLEEIRIKQISTNTAEVQSYALAEMNYLAPDNYYKLYKIRLRPNGKTDLALQAYSSAHEGPLYYYFLFDLKTKGFVISESPVPKLKYDAKSRRYISELGEVPYTLDQNLQFKAETADP